MSESTSSSNDRHSSLDQADNLDPYDPSSDHGGYDRQASFFVGDDDSPDGSVRMRRQIEAMFVFDHYTLVHLIFNTGPR